MRKIALPVMILGAAVAVVVAFRGAEAVRSAPEFPALDGHEPEWPPSNMRLLYRPAGKRFDCSAGISLPGRGVEPARILFNAQDTSNYNWAEFSVEGVRLGRTEADWETELARSPKGLAGGEVHDVTVKRRDAQIMAAVDGLLVLSALDESFGPGEVGAAAKNSAVITPWANI